MSMLRHLKMAINTKSQVKFEYILINKGKMVDECNENK